MAGAGAGVNDCLTGELKVRLEAAEGTESSACSAQSMMEGIIDDDEDSDCSLI